MQHEQDRMQRLVEAIEACRPGSDDLADPANAVLREELENSAALSSRYRRTQQLDGRIARAFRDVDVPEDLADRVFAGLERARVSSDASVGDEPVENGSAIVPLRERPGRALKRWAFAGGALVAAAAILLAVWIGTGGTDPLASGDVRQAGMSLFRQDGDSFYQGSLVSDVAPPEKYPLSLDLRLPGASWRWVESFLDHKAVAYDVQLPAGERATLYVFRAPVTGLPSAPPLTPNSSGGRSVAAWKSGDVVCVLVFSGDRGMYRRLIKPQGPIT